MANWYRRMPLRTKKLVFVTAQVNKKRYIAKSAISNPEELFGNVITIIGKIIHKEMAFTGDVLFILKQGLFKKIYIAARVLYF